MCPEITGLEWSGVESKGQRTKQLILGDSKREIKLRLQTITQLSRLTFARRVRFKTITCLHSNSKPGFLSAEESGMVSGIDDSEKVRRGKCCDFAMDSFMDNRI